jgi:hypothetical protein
MKIRVTLIIVLLGSPVKSLCLTGRNGRMIPHDYTDCLIRRALIGATSVRTSLSMILTAQYLWVLCVYIKYVNSIFDVRNSLEKVGHQCAFQFSSCFDAWLIGPPGIVD